MSFTVPLPGDHEDLRQAVRSLCADFPNAYWRKVDAEAAYPEDFVAALTAAGWLSALIPEEYGGSGLGISEVAPISSNLILAYLGEHTLGLPRSY